MTSIFTPTEAKTFRYQGQTPLATGYTDPELQEAADRITEDFAEICGVSFVPVTVTDEVLAGEGGPVLLLPRTRVTALAALARRWHGQNDWTALTVDELAGVVWERSGLVTWPLGYWPCGAGRVRATYSHGYAAPPKRIKEAALILAVEELAGSNISARATQQTNENGTFNLAVPGWRDNQPFGIPVVDAALARYSERSPGVG